MVAYEQAHAWRQLFALAISENMEIEELNDMCERVSGESNSTIAASIDWVSLKISHPYRVSCSTCSTSGGRSNHYGLWLRSRRGCTCTVQRIPVRGSFSAGKIIRSAHRLVKAYKRFFACQITLHKKPDLVESTLHPGLDDAHEQFMDTFDEMETQLGKEMARINELKQKLDQDPGKEATTLQACTCVHSPCSRTQMPFS